MEQHAHTGDARHDAVSPSYLTTLVANALHAHRSGQLEQAAPLYQEALAINPIHTEALHYYGVLQHQRRDHAAAADLLDHALQLEPTDAVCWSNRGLVAAALGRHEEARRCYWQALQLQPAFPDARNNLGVTLQAQGDHEGAVRQYRQALALNPSFVDARLNLGTALTKLEQYDEALACYEQALSFDPNSADAHFNAGNAMTAKGDSAEAIAHFRHALELRPGFANAHVNLGSAVGKLGDYAEAEQRYRRAVALKPNPTNLVCLGGSLGAQGRLDEEEVFYRRALELDPHYVDAHQNLAWTLLKRGDYAQGWAEYAKRWRQHDYAAVAVEGVPEWHGEPLEGRTILLVGDQGFGDQLQFVRFASVLAKLGATVDVCVREPLLPLAQGARVCSGSLCWATGRPWLIAWQKRCARNTPSTRFHHKPVLPQQLQHALRAAEMQRADGHKHRLVRPGNQQHPREKTPVPFVHDLVVNRIGHRLVTRQHLRLGSLPCGDRVRVTHLPEPVQGLHIREVAGRRLHQILRQHLALLRRRETRERAHLLPERLEPDNLAARAQIDVLQLRLGAVFRLQSCT